MVWMWFLLFFSQIWIASHVWFPKSQRLASTEQMFGTPYFCGLLLDQSLLFNRRSDKGKVKFRLDVKHNPSTMSRQASSLMRASILRGEKVEDEEEEEDEQKASVDTAGTKNKRRKISSQQLQRPQNQTKDEITRIMVGVGVYTYSTTPLDVRL